MAKSSSELSRFIKTLHAINGILNSVKTEEPYLKNKSYLFPITDYIKGTSLSKGSRLKIWIRLGF